MINFLNSGVKSAFYNMALDEYFFVHGQGAILRVYGWLVPTISIGYGQSAKNELDMEKVSDRGLDVVRRLTGGRAVLHDAEITYSITADIGAPFGETLSDTYHTIATALKGVLKILGVVSVLAKGSMRDVREKNGASLPCFASASRYELLVNGKKIIGSAQKRGKKRFLQHGSLILEQKLDITDFLKAPEHIKENYKEILAKESVLLNDVTNRRFTHDQLSLAFKEGFGNALSMDMFDLAAASADFSELSLLEKKYASEEWNN